MSSGSSPFRPSLLRSPRKTRKQQTQPEHPFQIPSVTLQPRTSKHDLLIVNNGQLGGDPPTSSAVSSSSLNSSNTILIGQDLFKVWNGGTGMSHPHPHPDAGERSSDKSQNLDAFMDLVMKCKQCHFFCSSRAEFQNHLLSEHNNVSKQHNST